MNPVPVPPNQSGLENNSTETNSIYRLNNNKSWMVYYVLAITAITFAIHFRIEHTRSNPGPRPLFADQLTAYPLFGYAWRRPQWSHTESCIFKIDEEKNIGLLINKKSNLLQKAPLGFDPKLQISGRDFVFKYSPEPTSATLISLSLQNDTCHLVFEKDKIEAVHLPKSFFKNMNRTTLDGHIDFNSLITAMLKEVRK